MLSSLDKHNKLTLLLCDCVTVVGSGLEFWVWAFNPDITCYVTLDVLLLNFFTSFPCLEGLVVVIAVLLVLWDEGDVSRSGRVNVRRQSELGGCSALRLP